jgi:hypothetical protein
MAGQKSITYIDLWLWHICRIPISTQKSITLMKTGGTTTRTTLNGAQQNTTRIMGDVRKNSADQEAVPWFALKQEKFIVRAEQRNEKRASIEGVFILAVQSTEMRKVLGDFTGRLQKVFNLD